MINNIVSEYADGVKPAEEREALFIKSLQTWLRPLSEEINRQNGKLVLYFASDGSNAFKIVNVSDALSEKVVNRFPTFLRRL